MDYRWCVRCGGTVAIGDVVVSHYGEYEGSRRHRVEASPCCGADLEDWNGRYPEAAAELAAENRAWAEAEKARKEEEYRESYVARGLD